MARYGDPTGWRYYREWAVCLALALWEELLAWVGLVVMVIREGALRGQDAFRRSRHRCARCGRPAVGRHALTRTLRCRRHL